MSSGEPWTPHDLALLKKKYAEAVAAGKDYFKWEGNDVWVEHVKSLIGILTERFKRKEKRK